MALSPEELANEISNFINGAREKDVDQLVKAMTRDHRTLQQGTFKMFLKFMELVASTDYGRDARNMAAHDMAKRLMEHYLQDKLDLFKGWYPHKSFDELKKMVAEQKPSGELPLI